MFLFFFFFVEFFTKSDRRVLVDNYEVATTLREQRDIFALSTAFN